MRCFSIFFSIIIITLVQFQEPAWAGERLRRLAIRKVAALRTVTASVVRKVPRATTSAAATESAPHEMHLNVSCPKSGTAAITAMHSINTSSIKTASLGGVATLNGCNGLNGSLTFDETGTYQKGIVSFIAALNGELVGQCGEALPLTINSNITFEGAVTIEKGGSAAKVTGTMQLTCGPLPVLNCAWNKINLKNEQALKEGCNNAGQQ